MMHWKQSFCRCWQQQLFGGVFVDVDVVDVVVVAVEPGGVDVVFVVDVFDDDVVVEVEEVVGVDEVEEVEEVDEVEEEEDAVFGVVVLEVVGEGGRPVNPFTAFPVSG